MVRVVWNVCLQSPSGLFLFRISGSVTASPISPTFQSRFAHRCRSTGVSKPFNFSLAYRMSGGCCGSTSAKVASIILIIIGIIFIIAAIVFVPLVGGPANIGGAMLITEGVLGLIFAYNAENRCWMITVNVVSIIMVVISVVWLIGSLSFAGILIALKVGCSNCGKDDYLCNEKCGIDSAPI
ncbi:uncharacterized protein LOC117119289 isoform X4 [Anneissia japonica]|uniref:uncharacterized protein LOC117119289 isoform X4 n=1 Tax=Anneissia japonica TaxID=1529436 RepID=UPI0014258E0F|nr:uncharacterized protein LOC117119289 isoform X4 [Anneissia japonica]